MRRPPSTPSAPVLALLLLAATACFEEPVREELELRFRPSGSTEQVEVALAVSFLVDDDRLDNHPLRNRIEGERHRLLAGRDDWALRFDRLDALSHELVYERDHGTLSGVRQTAQVELHRDPEALQRFFSDTLVNAFYRTEPAAADGTGRAELSLYPLAPGRASRRERQRLERAVAPWTEVLARYFRAAGALYDYLEDRPERAEVCFSVLLEGVLPEEDGGRRSLLLPREEDLVEPVEEAMAEAWEILLVTSREAYSLNEVSRLVYDPFPARVRVVPGGPLVEVEGFAEDGEGGLRVPGVSLWDALRSLQGRWLAPDPLLLYVEQAGGITGEPRGEPPGLGEIVAMERFHVQPPPGPHAIRAALEERLVPEPVYRVAWLRGESTSAGSRPAARRAGR